MLGHIVWNKSDNGYRDFKSTRRMEIAKLFSLSVLTLVFWVQLWSYLGGIKIFGMINKFQNDDFVTINNIVLTRIIRYKCLKSVILSHVTNLKYNVFLLRNLSNFAVHNILTGQSKLYTFDRVSQNVTKMCCRMCFEYLVTKSVGKSPKKARGVEQYSNMYSWPFWGKKIGRYFPTSGFWDPIPNVRFVHPVQRYL